MARTRVGRPRLALRKSNTGFPATRLRRALWPSPALLALTSCQSDMSMFEPGGQGAARIEGLWWLMFWIATVIFVIVLVLLGVALLRAKRGDADPRRHVSWGEPLIVIGGIAGPAVILGALFVVSLRDMSFLSRTGRDASLTIEVTGHDWWWEASYEGTTAITANEIHIPVGQPVRLRLETDDVIHSFWVPRLQAKTDMIPGTTNEMWLEADEPGRYRGQCAEYCGLQHANMIFYVEADPPAEFQEWLANESNSAEQPSGSIAQRGERVFMTSTCFGCHAIRGTGAASNVGPDLTHVGSRETIAAGVLANNRNNMAQWITEPQQVKPGAVMPPTDLSDVELAALLEYLDQLR